MERKVRDAAFEERKGFVYTKLKIKDPREPHLLPIWYPRAVVQTTWILFQLI